MHQVGRVELSVSVVQLAGEANSEFWGSVKAAVRERIGRLIVAVLNVEMDEFIGARWHERGSRGSAAGF